MAALQQNDHWLPHALGQLHGISTAAHIPRWKRDLSVRLRMLRVRATCLARASLGNAELAIALAEEAATLLRWADLNALAVTKIAKKVGKCFGSSRAAEFLSAVRRSREFMQGPRLVELRSCEKLLAGIRKEESSPQSKESPGEHSCADDGDALPTSCPSCLDVLFDPVGLGCGHVLCRQYSHHHAQSSFGHGSLFHCPLCRKESLSAPAGLPMLNELVRSQNLTEFRVRERKQRRNRMTANNQMLVTAVAYRPPRPVS